MIVSEFFLGVQPELHIASLGAPVLYPDRMGALTGMVAFLQLIGGQFGLVSEILERLRRPIVGNQLLDPSIAFCPSPKLTYFLHLDTPAIIPPG